MRPKKVIHRLVLAGMRKGGRHYTVTTSCGAPVITPMTSIGEPDITCPKCKEMKWYQRLVDGKVVKCRVKPKYVRRWVKRKPY